MSRQDIIRAFRVAASLSDPEVFTDGSTEGDLEAFQLIKECLARYLEDDLELSPRYIQQVAAEAVAENKEEE